MKCQRVSDNVVVVFVVVFVIVVVVVVFVVFVIVVVVGRLAGSTNTIGSLNGMSTFE